MLKKFGYWFLCFGLSYLIQSLNWMEQGKAFLMIHLSVSAVLLLICLIIYLFLGNDLGQHLSFSFVTIGIMAFTIAITLFATWIATKIFNVDFYVAYQIMVFGRCLCSSADKKDK